MEEGSLSIGGLGRGNAEESETEDLKRSFRNKCNKVPSGETLPIADNSPLEKFIPLQSFFTRKPKGFKIGINRISKPEGTTRHSSIIAAA